jgi:diketogulonate reductase-like aldo/keto reductase
LSQLPVREYRTSANLPDRGSDLPVLQRSPTILLIPGASSVAHLRENAAAAGVELPAEAVATLNAVGTADRFAPWAQRRP